MNQNWKIHRVMWGREEHPLTVFVPWDCGRHCPFCTTKREYETLYCGQLAGAKYGLSAIPERWLAAIKERAKLADLFERFLAALGWSSLASAAAFPL